ncbi:MAG TPA: polysaccharide deacetylase family protein [Xanthobacteraceae bacterium]|nr:polysaccharide deacetylase family protein [Xanthobacteraceae bacterium]
MRVVVVVIAALMTLGLAAFGVVAAQKATLSSSAAELIARVTSRDQGPNAPAARTAPVRVADASRSPIIASSPVPAEPVAVAPQRVAQNTASAAVVAATPAAPAIPAAPGGTAAGTAGTPASIAACDKPGGMGLSRIVEIDTTGGPGFGFEHFKQYDFLRMNEIVLTFDDGPWPENTPAVLKALADNCLKATFFEIGQHAMWHPEIAKEVAAAGHTIGSHTWSHKDLARNPYASDIELAKQEIEMGVSAVHAAVAAPIAPFFRFPNLQHPPALLSYLAERNIASFSTDIDSFDFKMRKPEQVIDSVISKLQKHGKGIILMHDFQRATAEALPELLHRLKAAGYKVVHVVPHAPVTTLPKYDEMVAQQDKLSANNTRPQGSVFHTIGEYVGAPAPASANRD